MAKKENINMHGQVHHILDGACLLIAYENAGGEIDIDQALEKLMRKVYECLETCEAYGVFVVQ